MWNVKQTLEFQKWFDESDDQLKNDSLKHIELIRQIGPQLSRPYSDTIKGSTIKNLKELRFDSNKGVIRIFYVFDPDRNGILLIGGNKAGSGDKRFYKVMIAESETIYSKFRQGEKHEKQKI